jgi:hypothetical protein
MFLIWLKQNFQMAAHIKMVPFERTESLKTHLTNIKPQAAYDDVILSKGMTHLVLIVRNSYEGVHSGQIWRKMKRKMRIFL